MTFYYIIADSYDDYKDYILKYEIPESEAKHVRYDTPFPCSLKNRTIDIHFLHITKFAAKIEGCKTKFVDLQILLSQKMSNVKTCIETEDKVVVSAVLTFHF